MQLGRGRGPSSRVKFSAIFGSRGAVVEPNLPISCVEALFKPNLIQQCQAEANINIAQPVTQGASRIRQSHAVEAGTRQRPSMDPSVVGSPRVVYQQHEQEMCDFRGAASALHEYGFRQEAILLAGEFAYESLSRPDRMRFLLETIDGTSNGNGKNKGFKGFSAGAISSSTFDHHTHEQDGVRRHQGQYHSQPDRHHCHQAPPRPRR